MPIHNWTLVPAGIFHDFHHTWITEIKRALNSGLLPPGYYALAEQITGGLGPDVLALQAPAVEGPKRHETNLEGGATLAVAPPHVRFHFRAEADQYAAKANAVTIRHVSHHHVVAMVEVVSPGNKNSRHGLRRFVTKAEEVLRVGVHLLIVDLFPPGPFDPHGIHEAIWAPLGDEPYLPPLGKPLTLAAYVGGPAPEAFVEPSAVGMQLAVMPLFLATDGHVPAPLEETYQAAWSAVPSFWRDVLASG